MIKKILEIKDFAVFKNFEWDKHVVDTQGKAVCLQDVNIFFGRNYSGKTTLSRIFRAFELKGGLEKYEGGTFKFEMNDKSIVDESTLENLSYPVRVFNEDFVRENLLFINVPEQGVAPFAVLGGNVEIEQEIQELKEKLGSPDEGNETGLYRERLIATNAYNIAYAAEPEKLSIEMKDFLSPIEERLPGNHTDIYFKELGNESPILVKLLMKTIYQNDKRTIKHIGTQQFGMKFLLRGLYAHNGLLYFHPRIDNDTNMPYSVDFISFKIVDKKVAKRTAIQEQVLQPLRAYHQVMYIKGNREERTIFALEQFSLSEDKQLEVTLYERNGGRTLTFYVEQEDLLLAKKIDNLKLKW